MAIQELTKFRQKYPQYNDMDDSSLAQKLATKYPDAYGDLPSKVQPELAAQPSPQIPQPIQRPSFMQKLPQIGQAMQRGLPVTGQIVGGIAGGIAGATVGHPYIGSAIGGTTGRALGKLEKLTVNKEKPFKVKLASLMGPIGKYGALYSMLSPEEKVDFGKDLFRTGAIETVAAPFGYGATKLATGLGKGIVKGLLTPRVAERGIKQGWKNILKPEYFKGGVPKAISKRTHSLFNRLTEVTGRNIQNLINSKYKNTLINVTSIKNQIKTLLPKSGKAGDLLELTASKAQRSMLNELSEQVLKMKGNVRKLPNLWEIRKTIDKSIYRHRWSPDAMKFLQGIRRALNEPIKSAGEDITEAFGKYSFVMNAQDDLARRFNDIVGPGGEIYSQRLEAFAGNLLSSSKDETIRMLVDLDSMLGLDDKVIGNLLNYAAAESLQKEVMGIGIFQRLVIGMLGGRKTIAQLGRLIQTPIVQGTKTIIGRAIPTILSRDIPKIITEESKLLRQ